MKKRAISENGGSVVRKIKRAITAILLIIVLSSVAIASTAAYAAELKTRALVPCSLYSDETLSESVRDIQRNEEITVLEDGEEICKVSVNGVEGYVRKINLYETDTDFSKHTETKRIGTGNFSNTVNVYKYPYEDSTVVATLKDNDTVEVVQNGMSYGEFLEIKYQGGRAFILESDVADGLTYTMTVTIVLSVVGGVLLIVLLLLIVFGLKLKKR